MIYKLASRDNIDSERFESWPAVLNNSFKKFNNMIEEPLFNSEDDILNWLESKCRTKSTNRYTNIQEFKNGDPNKLYSVYLCKHENPYHNNETCDIFLYSLRIKKPSEAFMTFTNERGKRINSSFKKIDIQMPATEIFEFSSDIREIRKEYFEGIYPIDINYDDPKDVQYMEYVKKMHNYDNDENKNKEYIMTIDDKTKWIDYFLHKLNHIEKYLRFFAEGGDIYININPSDVHNSLIDEIFKLLDDNAKNTIEDISMQLKIKNLIVDPLLSEGEIFQVRHNKSLVTWHANYSHIIRKFKIIPSKQFVEMILNFNLSDFFKQVQSDDNLLSMINNIKEIYKINDVKQFVPKNDFKLLGKNPPKFQKIIKTFN
jgi:hypothetical protein